MMKNACEAFSSMYGRIKARDLRRDRSGTLSERMVAQPRLDRHNYTMPAE